MKVKVGKLMFGFVLMLFTLRLVAAPTVVSQEKTTNNNKEQLNPLHQDDTPPLKVWFGDLSSSSENEGSNEEEGKNHDLENDYLSFFNKQLSTQYDSAICKHHYPLNSRDLSHQIALYISFCVYRI